jgi:UDP-glucose 4-epimerase
MASILVTGGAGYVGSHCAKALAAAGHEAIVFDNLSFGHREFVRWGKLVEGDIRDSGALEAVFRTYCIPGRNGHPGLPTRDASRRPGDPAILVADATRARDRWSADRSDLTTIISDAWRWNRQRLGQRGKTAAGVEVPNR